MNDTIEALVENIQSGTRGDMERLWTQLQAEVWRQARKWAAVFRTRRPCVTAEDLYQCGYLALDRAVREYAPEGVMPFHSWFLILLRLEFARAAGHRAARVLGLLEADESPGPWSASVEQALEELPEEAYHVLRLRYGLGLSRAEIGPLLEVSEAEVNALEERGLQILREGTQGARLWEMYRERLGFGQTTEQPHT